MSCVINPYDLLGVTIKTSKSELRSRYYELSLLVHPDKGGSSDDMIILHNAYKFVLKEIENINTSITIEKLESDFKIFCNVQEQQVPLFRDIYAEAFDLEIFNTKFKNAIDSEIYELFNSSLEGGYGDLMENSELIQQDNPIYQNLTNSNITNNFGAINVYSDHIKEQTYFNNVYDYKSKKIDNYSLAVNGLSMCDYKEAYTTIIYDDSNVVTTKERTLDDIENERKDMDSNTRHINYMWSFSGFLDSARNQVKNILKIE